MLTADRLRELLHYDPETGGFYWRETGKGRRLDLLAGTISDSGYRIIVVDGKQHRAHRLAWLYVHGEWPPGPLDHRTQNKDDNRITELRPTNHSLNGANRGRTAKKTTPYKGVFFLKGQRSKPWLAQIRLNGRALYLGIHASPEDAARAYDARARAVWGDHAHTNF